VSACTLKNFVLFKVEAPLLDLSRFEPASVLRLFWAPHAPEEMLSEGMLPCAPEEMLSGEMLSDHLPGGMSRWAGVRCLFVRSTLSMCTSGKIQTHTSGF
jgi:hypothetical protein